MVMSAGMSLTGGSEISPDTHLILWTEGNFHPGRHYYRDFVKIGVSGPSSSLIYTGDLSPPTPLGFFWERARHCIITRTEGNLTSSRQTLLSRFYVKLAYQDPLVPYIYAGDLSPPLGTLSETGPFPGLGSSPKMSFDPFLMLKGAI